MKKRLLSALLTLGMVFTMLPVGVLAAETGSAEDLISKGSTVETETSEGMTVLTQAGSPTITALSVAGNNVEADSNGSLITSVSANMDLTGKEFSMETSEAVTFVVDSTPETGSMYVSAATSNSVTLTLALGTSTNYSISMTTTDGINWSGSFSNNFGLTMGGLATALSSEGAALAAGSMESNATGAASEGYKLFCNQDAVNAQLIMCLEDTPTYTVNYVVTYDDGDPETAYSWTVPSGALLTQPQLNLLSTQTLDGWYSDANCTQSVVFGSSVTGNLTLYAKVATSASGSFAQDFAAQKTVLTISNTTDWASFISLASQINSNQLVVLDTDIDCDGAAYTALTFAGNFDGQKHTISNATFSASGGYSGMFKTIGPNQKVCNLILSDVTASYAGTYSGVLAGAIAGTEGNNALVQNVQIWDGSASGRSAGGLAGYIFWADVKYCGVYETTVTGIANGGGIGGISYGFITECYAIATPTALTSNGRGGIAGKNLDGGTITSSWCTYSKVVGKSTDATETNCLANVDSLTQSDAFTGIGLTSARWNIGNGTETDLDMNKCFYPFPQLAQSNDA